MVTWLLAALLIGEFVGLILLAVFPSDKIDDPQPKKGGTKNVQKAEAE